MLRYHACALVDIHVYFATWDVGYVLGGIGDWECGTGVIDVISTCEAIVQVGEEFYFVGVGCPHVSFTSTYSLAA